MSHNTDQTQPNQIKLHPIQSNQAQPIETERNHIGRDCYQGLCSQSVHLRAEQFLGVTRNLEVQDPDMTVFFSSLLLILVPL